MIKWKKIGLIIKPKKNTYWMKTHCMVPTPVLLSNGIVKVFFSGRDESNISYIGYALVDLKSNGQIISYSKDPILYPGRLGCFDDNGVTPSCVLNLGNNEMALYYIGWNPGSTVRVNLFGGLAISKDGGNSFERWSEAPILERTKTDPFMNTAPWVVKNGNKYIMYYVSGHSWINKDFPKYNIKIAFSKDGKNWERNGKVCLDFKDTSENALARPYVLFDNNAWKMWFSYKVDRYLIGYAESNNGIDWDRKKNESVINLSRNGFDSEMIEYASVLKYENRYYMFYNGNNYGADGIGLAIEEK